MKKKYLYTSAAVLLLGIGAYQFARFQDASQDQKNKVAYVESDDKKSTHSDQHAKEENAKSDEVSAEAIVVKITDEGYVTVHGDHFHNYNGKVPFDALLSEELLLKDSSYQFHQEDVVNEVKDGYIIKFNDSYYLYLKDGVNPVNVRTKEDIERQQKEGATDHDHDHDHDDEHDGHDHDHEHEDDTDHDDDNDQ